MSKYILASGSPRRKQLLEWAELDFEIIVSDTDESFPFFLSPAEASIHVSKEKAIAVQQLVDRDKIIIAADTIVVLQEQIIGKPQDREDAIDILSKLNGAVHEVITGVTILSAGKEITFHDQTKVEFHHLTANQISYYVDKYEPYDKAGAYAIQEWIGVVGIKSIQGDFYNVMGLPVSRVLHALAQFS
jgi:septum formation protein